jgi:hypothetical protein
MGLYSEANAGSARLIALAAIIGGAALIMDFRPSGLAFALGGVILFLGAGDEISPTTTHDILPTIGFFCFLILGGLLFSSGF